MSDIHLYKKKTDIAKNECIDDVTQLKLHGTKRDIDKQILRSKGFRHDIIRAISVIS